MFLWTETVDEIGPSLHFKQTLFSPEELPPPKKFDRVTNSSDR